jgi:hypothetical protein
MSLRGRRVLSFAGEVAGIEWSGAAAGDAVAWAFGPRADDETRLPDIVLRLGTRDDSGVATLFHGRDCVYRGESLGTATHLLIEGALDGLIRESRGGLVFHAALLAHGAHGVLLPAPSGSGKTMLAAWLALRGLDHLTDEAFFLADGEPLAQPFPRPFCFKGPWAEVLGLDAPDRSRVMQNEGVSLVDPSLFGSRPRRAAIRPRLMVFPRFHADAPLELTRLTPAHAAVRLIETVANARNLPDHGLGCVTTLARNVETYHLTYGRFDQLRPFLDLIESLP